MKREKPRILHVTPHLGGGVGRVLLNYVSAAREKGQQHSVVCLDYANEPAKARAAEEGIPLADNMFWRQGELGEAAAKADIVTVHWWNHPLLYLWMALGKTPRARVLLWSHVSGFTAPQVMTDFALSWPDIFAVSTPGSFNQPLVGALSEKNRADRLRLIFSCGGIAHVKGYSQRGHEKHRVGYLGTVDYDKMHPKFLDLCVKSHHDGTIFPVAGGPSHESLRMEAESMGAADKFEILGPISNVGEFLSTLDVFGYPLCRDHYGTGEQVLIEAMAVGVPQVVLQRDSKEYVVENGVTGLVADTLDDYCRCLDRLQNDDDLRRGLAKNSFERARLRFGIENTIASFDSIYEELMELPKRRREFAGAEERLTPDRVFTLSQGPEAEKVYRLLDGCGAEADVSRLPALSWSQTRGSVFHYAHFCPENARLARLKGLMAALRPPRSAFQYN